MCFNQEMSFGFSALGLAVAAFVYYRSENVKLTIGILFFFTMEFLQGMQYFWIDQCKNPINKILTVAGFAHICLQPYFTHLINSSMTRNERVLDQYKIVLRLSLLAGLSLFMRYVLSDYTIHPVSKQCPTNEWLRGQDLCTYKGSVHLAWSVPMKESSYFIPSSFIHCFMMMAPFLVMGQKYMWVQGVFLFFTGPWLAGYITDNLQEQASIWCFFSICQIGIMVFLIRDKLIKPAAIAQKIANKKKKTN